MDAQVTSCEYRPPGSGSGCRRRTGSCRSYRGPRGVEAAGALWLQSFGIRVTVDTGNNFIQLSLHASRFGLEKRGINQELYWLPLDVADN